MRVTRDVAEEIEGAAAKLRALRVVLHTRYPDIRWTPAREDAVIRALFRDGVPQPVNVRAVASCAE